MNEVQLKSVATFVQGFQELVDWFGYVPDFHDWEIEECAVSNSGDAVMKIRAWRMTDEVDENGYFKADRHALVKLRMSDIVSFELSKNDGTNQNVIGQLHFRKSDDCVMVEWDSSTGFKGRIVGRSAALEIDPVDLDSVSPNGSR